MSLQKHERYGPNGELVSVVEIETPDTPHISTVLAAREALKTIQKRQNLNADLKAIIDFLILISYEFEGAAANV